MEDLEGYFEPLDNSLVLRKNLLGPDSTVFLGTALHELVHALIQSDYPQAPPWLNEGLAAIHEQYGQTGPLDNYKLYVAKAALQSQGKWPKLTDLLNARPVWWTTEARGVMAAASRYFCMFLWRENKLPAVYKALRNAPKNESVTDTIQRVTGKSIQELE
jgi:hypothetical protein